MPEPGKPQPSEDKASLKYGSDVERRLVGGAKHYSGHEAPAQGEEEARAPSRRKPERSR
jgi:hypothetical protein